MSERVFDDERGLEFELSPSGAVCMSSGTRDTPSVASWLREDENSIVLPGFKYDFRVLHTSNTYLYLKLNLKSMIPIGSVSYA